MSTHSLRELRANLGATVRDVAYTGEEAIITDNGREVAVIISVADYERLHEHADVFDSVRLSGRWTDGAERLSMAEMLDRLGVSEQAYATRRLAAT